MAKIIRPFFRLSKDLWHFCQLCRRNPLPPEQQNPAANARRRPARRATGNKFKPVLPNVHLELAKMPSAAPWDFSIFFPGVYIVDKRPGI
jgi:hypothetical protein